MPRLLHIDQSPHPYQDFPRHQHGAWMTIIYLKGVERLSSTSAASPSFVDAPSSACPRRRRTPKHRSMASQLVHSLLRAVPLADRCRSTRKRAPGRSIAWRWCCLRSASPAGARGWRSRPCSRAALVYLQHWPLARRAGAERLRTLLLANLENHEFEIREAIAVLPWSATHLRKAFARAAGMTPQAYLARARIEKAKRLLRIGGFSVKQIAHSVGIADPHYFSRMFRRLAGCRPGDYRRGHAG